MQHMNALSTHSHHTHKLCKHTPESAIAATHTPRKSAAAPAPQPSINKVKCTCARITPLHKPCTSMHQRGQTCLSYPQTTQWRLQSLQCKSRTDIHEPCCCRACNHAHAQKSSTHAQRTCRRKITQASVISCTQRVSQN